MAKRREIGSVVKGKDGKPDYIKINSDVTLKKGQYVNLESPKQQIESLQAAVESGKLTAEYGEKLLARLEATPDWVRFNLFVSE